MDLAFDHNLCFISMCQLCKLRHGDELFEEILENSFYENRNNEFLQKITNFFLMIFSEIQMMKDVYKTLETCQFWIIKMSECEISNPDSVWVKFTSFLKNSKVHVGA